jgi:hypothetical protein
MIDLKEYDLIQIYLFFIRNVLQYTMSLDLFLGMFYLTCHCIYIIFISTIICFKTNINHLSIILIFITINLISIMVLKTCPIYLMERKYINTSLIRSFMKICGVLFSSEKKNVKDKKYVTRYLDFCIDEYTFELVFISYLLVVLKIMFLIIL